MWICRHFYGFGSSKPKSRATWVLKTQAPLVFFCGGDRRPRDEFLTGGIAVLLLCEGAEVFFGRLSSSSLAFEKSSEGVLVLISSSQPDAATSKPASSSKWSSNPAHRAVQRWQPTSGSGGGCESDSDSEENECAP